MYYTHSYPGQSKVCLVLFFFLVSILKKKTALYCQTLFVVLTLKMRPRQLRVRLLSSETQRLIPLPSHAASVLHIGAFSCELIFMFRNTLLCLDSAGALKKKKKKSATLHMVWLALWVFSQRCGYGGVYASKSGKKGRRVGYDGKKKKRKSMGTQRQQHDKSRVT